jgi:hypothetical protein
MMMDDELDLNEDTPEEEIEDDEEDLDLEDAPLVEEEDEML